MQEATRIGEMTGEMVTRSEEHMKDRIGTSPAIEINDADILNPEGSVTARVTMQVQEMNIARRIQIQEGV